MAIIHPHRALSGPMTAGDYREQDLLLQLKDGLPDSFDVFHGLGWSAMHDQQQQFGELDLTLVSPDGQVLILEVKAGDVQTQDGQLIKSYGHDNSKNIGHQARKQHSVLRHRLKEAGLSHVHVDAMLVLPDHRLGSEGLAYPRERMVDATQMPAFCSIVRSSFSTGMQTVVERRALMDFLSSQYQLYPDVGTQIGQVQQTSTRLSGGLATWVPRISHESQVYVIEATAGSGKTQLALKLLRDAAQQKQRARYVCFNRPLADHLQTMAPGHAEVTTFHQLCREHAERTGLSLDFSSEDVFKHIVSNFVQAAEALPQNLDLLVIDESQDFDPDWVQALAAQLHESGRLYVLGDADQQLYEREAFELPGAVRLNCMDNYRSPQKVVSAINQLRLTAQPVVACSAHPGQTPGFHTYDGTAAGHNAALNRCLKDLQTEGFAPSQVAVISFRGVKNSRVLAMDTLGGYTTRRTTGKFDEAGNALWHEGELQVESVYRYKGQSAPAVVLCEVDFEELSYKEKHKLFVGLTRGQVRVDVVIYELSANLLLNLHSK
jgi:hypothetical protein